MKSFHGNAELKAQLVSNLKAHAAADEIVQGTYWSDGKGCAVGCSIVDFGGETDNHSEYERLFGIPRQIARLEDGIFEGLSTEDSKWWPQAFAEAVPVNVDLSMVIPKFSVWLLNDDEHGVKKYASEDGKKAIAGVVALYHRKIAGEDVSTEEWKAARSAAYAAAGADADDAYAYADADAAAYAGAAAYAAAYADADAADAAAYAADAAARRQSRKIQADKLIEILKAEA